MHTPAEIGIDDFQAKRSPDEHYRTAPLKGLWTHQKGGFYHDGRFATLPEVVEHYNTFKGLGLTTPEKQEPRAVPALDLKSTTPDPASTTGSLPTESGVGVQQKDRRTFCVDARVAPAPVANVARCDGLAGDVRSAATQTRVAGASTSTIAPSIATLR